MGSGPGESTGHLPMFHALTGCDTISFFAGRGTRTVCEVWTAVLELTQVLIDLTAARDQVDEDATHTMERFLLYDRTSTSTDVDKTRCKLFARKNNVQLIPPTSAALKQHVRRAVYQGRHVWSQALLPAPALPSLID